MRAQRVSRAHILCAMRAARVARVDVWDACELDCEERVHVRARARAHTRLWRWLMRACNVCVTRHCGLFKSVVECRRRRTSCERDSEQGGCDARGVM